MNTAKQTLLPAKQSPEPLYASPWIALFVVLRRELSQAFSHR